MPLVPEKYDVDALVEELKHLGWRGPEVCGYGEKKKDPIVWEKFERVFQVINNLGNRGFSKDEITQIFSNIREILDRTSPVDFLEMLRNGVSLRIKNEPQHFVLIDYRDISRNDFCAAREVEFPGEPVDSRPDLVLYVNGLPLVVVEAKASTRSLDAALEEGLSQLDRYERSSPDIFRYVQLGVVYVGREESVFRPTLPNWSNEERFIPYGKWMPPDEDKGRYDIIDLLKPARLLDIIRWYLFFRGKGEGKIVGRYIQYHAAEKAFERIRAYMEGASNKNKGLIWHWQGSGKTYTMFFIAYRFFRSFIDKDPIVFFVVDRRELQRQLYEDFLKNLVAPGFTDMLTIVESVDELKNILLQIHQSEVNNRKIKRGVYIALIQKYRVDELKDLPPVRKREVLILIDEAHRSQYGILAATLRRMFPNAVRIAFTGTPVFKFERNTFREFAYPEENEFYLHKYFISDSIKDGFTVPITYQLIREAPGTKILLDEEDIKSVVGEWRKKAEELGSLDEYLEEAEEGFERGPVVTKAEIRRRLNKIKVFLENEKRLKALARHIAERVEEDTEGFKFKAMIVTASRIACVRMKKYLDEALRERYGDKAVNWSEVVMTYTNNDPPEIERYRIEMLRRWLGTSNTEALKDFSRANRLIQDAFKEKKDPRILIVTDMLITGFDCPILKVMYLDKQLYDHRLLQAIARVNRPYRVRDVKKEFGLVVDSVRLLKQVKESIMTYEAIGDALVAEDLRKSMMADVEEAFQEYVIWLNNLKQRLKEGVNVGTFTVRIDIDKIKRLYEIDKAKLKEYLEERVKPQLSILALGIEDPQVTRIIDLMKKLLKRYDSLGSYPEKVKYSLENKIISTLFMGVLQTLKGRRLSPKFWEFMLKEIHARTRVTGFEIKETVTLTPNDIENITQDLDKALKLGRPANHLAAEAFTSLRIFLELDRANPVYKHIYQRLKKLEEEWLNTGEDSVLHQFLSVAMEVINYAKETQRMGFIERIIRDIRTSLKDQYGIDVKLEELQRKLSEIRKEAGCGPLLEKWRKEIFGSIYKDITRAFMKRPDLKTVSPREKKKVVNEFVEYIEKRFTKCEEKK